MRCNAIDKRRTGDIVFLLATKNRGLGRRLQHTDSIQRRLGRFVMRRSDRTTEPVHKGAVGLVLDLVAPTTGGMVDDVLRQNAGEDRKSVVWGKSVSVRVDLGGRRIIKTKKN